MSWITDDVKCLQGHVEPDHLYRKSEGPTSCPECGEARTVTYLTVAAVRDYSDPSVGTFRPIIVGGTTYHTREDLNRYLDSYSKKHNVPRDQIEFDSRGSNAERKVMREELRHEAVVMRRKQGYDEQQFRDYQREQRERR